MRYMMSHFIESQGLFYFSMLYTYEAKGGKAKVEYNAANRHRWKVYALVDRHKLVLS